MFFYFIFKSFQFLGNLSHELQICIFFFGNSQFFEKKRSHFCFQNMTPLFINRDKKARKRWRLTTCNTRPFTKTYFYSPVIKTRISPSCRRLILNFLIPTFPTIAVFLMIPNRRRFFSRVHISVQNLTRKTIFSNDELHIILKHRNLEICKHSSFFNY